jgi:alpha-1,2-mannosyltransferase
MSVLAVGDRGTAPATDVAAGPPPGPARAAVTVVPAWFLLPGLGLLAASLGGYAQYQRTRPASGLDLGIYRQAARAFLAGREVYGLTFTHGLPYTYPPVTLPLLAPLAAVGDVAALTVLTAVSVAAAFLTVWCCTGLLGYCGAAGRLGVAGAVTGLALWLEPLTSTLDLGQVNAVLMLLVVADLALPAGHRAKGAGIGVAAACKLVPGIFVLHLLLTRRRRAAAVAVVAFGAATAAGCVVAPRDSAAYWLHGLFLDSSRVSAATGPAFVGNQSLRGVLLRTLGGGVGVGVVWLLVAVGVAVCGLTLAARAHRRGEEAAAVTIVAFTAVLACPISWSHHWVWVVVLLPVLFDVVRRTAGRGQVLAAGLLPVWTVMLAVWPLRGRPGEPVSASGVIWVAYRHDRPWCWLGQNLYVMVALGTLGVAAWWLRDSSRDAPPTGTAELEPARSLMS